LGTQYEAERAKQQFQVDGFFDIRERDIKTLSDRLKLWEPKPEPPAYSPQEKPPYLLPPDTSAQEQPAHSPSPELHGISEGLNELSRAVNRLVDVAAEILEKIFREKRKK
jgi:hypothetical protein